VVNFTPWPLYLKVKNPQFLLNMRLGRPVGGVNTYWRREKSDAVLGFEPRISSP
jgi:hypothetical protein